MMKKLARFLKKEYAVIIVSAAFLYFAVTFIGNFFSYYRVKITPSVSIEDLSITARDSFLAQMEDFYGIVKRERKPEAVAVTLDITDRFQKRGGAGSMQMKKVECWQCGKLIPFEKTVCPFCGAIQKHTDTDKDGMPDYWEIRYKFDPEDEIDAAQDADGDKYTNLEEYRNGSDPTNPQSTPVTVSFKYEVVKIFRKPVDILFRGYVEIGDEYTLEITWEKETGGKTYFKKIGEDIRGYTIVEFKKVIREQSKADKGVVIDVDESYIALQKREAQPIRLQKNKVFIEKEVNARLRNKDNKKETDVHVGSEFEAVIDGRNEAFTVTDITIDQVFYQDKKGNINYIFWKE